MDLVDLVDLAKMSHPQPGKPRCIVYVDGYNWYQAIFKHYPEWKWLNMQRFFEVLRPRQSVELVKVFSALICDAEARGRQERYFATLKTLPKVRVILGAFQPREVQCRAQCGQRYVVQDEKKTDVNMAVENLSDAVGGACEAMCIVTADSDVQPAVEWVAKNRRSIELTVLVPSLPAEQRDRRTDDYKTRGLPMMCDFLPLSAIKDLQLPNLVKLADGTFAVRPATWSERATTAP